jgi:hypothetical protein
MLSPRHGKPRNDYLNSLKKPKRADYEKLVHACVDAIVQGEKDIIVAFAYTLKFPKDFPKGILERKEGNNNIHRIKARKLLMWLHSKGYTPITVAGLKYQAMELGKVTSFLNKFDQDFVDIEQELIDNDVIETDEGEN